MVSEADRESQNRYIYKKKRKKGTNTCSNDGDCRVLSGANKENREQILKWTGLK